ncbi:MAG: hypothetical protein FWD97_06710 [Defluviitaleaceae bacterium]|nr:hypothetical protein [Defluviitaleaceae bacterium]
MENQNTKSKIGHHNILQIGTWASIFDLITNLIDNEKESNGENVDDLKELYDFAEEIERRTLELLS